jgi:hypothetical protein
MTSAQATQVHASVRDRIMVAAVAAIFLLSGLIGAPASRVLGASLADFPEPFHFLEPLGSEAGNAARFDPSLLEELVVDICRVEASSCTPVKTLTSQSSLSERLRIGSTSGTGSYYLANWDVSKVKLSPWTFRVRVTVAGLQLGSIDVGPNVYKSFGRTWPIKFRVEKHPKVRVRVLHLHGQSASQIANAIKLEFQLGPDDVRTLLANDLEPFSDEEIDLAIKGVFQPAVIPATTKVADAATQAALTAFDPATGRMTFGTSTSTLGALKVGDVLVGEPITVAPNGYLRYVTAITKPKKGPIVVETRQALINETIRVGTLDAAAQLEPDDLLRTESMPGVTFSGSSARQMTAMAGFGALDVGDGYSFHETIDVTIDGSASSEGVTGNGTIHIKGRLDFNAGWNIGFGVEDCFDEFPPVCVDRFEAHLGMDASSDIHVDGNFNGHMEKEYVLSTHYFKPIIFFIGPIPVVLVPIVKAIAGATGDAHLAFSFDAQVSSRLELGAKWTDPGDGGHGWENLNNDMTPTGFGKGDLQASMELRAYAKTDAKLLLYGIAGPGLAGRIGVGATVQYPGNPLWEVFGHARGELNFAVDIGGVLKLAEHVADLPEFKVHLAYSDNKEPECGARKDPIPVAVGAETYLGPRTGTTFQGYFVCTDPEGEDVSYSAKEGTTSIDYEKAKWDQPGTHYVDVTATDESGKSREFRLTIDVIDTPPLLSLIAATSTVPASVQYFVTASAFDVEDNDWLTCASLTWSATGGTVTPTLDNRNCTAVVVFDLVGSQTVKVVATDSNNKSSEASLTVDVTPVPANPAPLIDPNSFDVWAASGPKTNCDDLSGAFCEPHYSCPTGFFCPVPSDSLLYNGVYGQFHNPLTFSLNASDPNGDIFTVTWHCSAGLTPYAVADNGDETSSCSPYTESISTPIMIWAEVFDGVTTVYSEARRLLMLDRVG